jgi:hypothetical protein
VVEPLGHADRLVGSLHGLSPGEFVPGLHRVGSSVQSAIVAHGPFNSGRTGCGCRAQPRARRHPVRRADTTGPEQFSDHLPVRHDVGAPLATSPSSLVGGQERPRGAF